MMPVERLLRFNHSYAGHGGIGTFLTFKERADFDNAVLELPGVHLVYVNFIYSAVRGLCRARQLSSIMEETFPSNHNPSETIAAPQALTIHRLERSVASRLSEHNPEIAVIPWT